MGRRTPKHADDRSILFFDTFDRFTERHPGRTGDTSDSTVRTDEILPSRGSEQITDSSRCMFGSRLIGRKQVATVF